MGKSILVGSVERELHQVGAKMVCDFMEIEGWNTFYLGASTPTNEMLSFIEENRPDLVGLSMSIYFNLPGLQKMMNAINSAFPDMPILIGGQGLCKNGEIIANKQKSVHYIPNLERLKLLL